MKDRFITIFRSYDPIQAEIIVDILSDNGIKARKIGSGNAALIGVGQSIIQVRIETLESQAKEALEFIEEFVEGDGNQALEDAGVFDHDEDDEPSAGAGLGPRSPLLAGGAVTLMLGGSHFYSQRHWTAGLILVGQLLAFARMYSGHSGYDWPLLMSGVGMYFTFMLCDFVGGQLASRSYNAGRRASPVAQLAIGTAFMAAALTAGALLAKYIAVPSGY